MGNRQDNLGRALDLLSQRLRVGKVSSIYDTEPIGNVNQPRFLNLACQAYTKLDPVGLLVLAKGIELKLGRAINKRNTPRPIDIDILFYGDLFIETPDLVIPHTKIIERAFVLIPMMEIAPELVHPIRKKPVKELAKALTEVQGVLKLENN
jgi:2-amino-4-hydroxy-6-hydroxymethyldihydropteridine diphosphokinase